MNKKICNKLPKVPEGQELFAYKESVINELVLDKAYGGFEGKMEDGELVHFKYWVSKKK